MVGNRKMIVTKKVQTAAYKLMNLDAFPRLKGPGVNRSGLRSLQMMGMM